MSAGEELPPILGHVLPVGTRLADYEIEGLIGEGGFGIVYRAFDHSLDRRVALKEYMPAAIASRVSGSTRVAVKAEARHGETFRIGLRSFVNEARLLARFDHPALVKVFRFWEADGTAYMAMPYYEGPTLKAALAALGRPPTEAEIGHWIAPLVDALAVLHAAHCFHRDIAPDNILLTPRGPLLLDFGAARHVIGDRTQALTVVLKPGFAPIEQYGEARSMAQGAWTDFYALASVVRFAITGAAPVSAVERLMDDRLEPLAEIARGRYSARFLGGLDRALALRPQNRPQDAAAFREALGLPDATPRAVVTVPAPLDDGMADGAERAGLAHGWAHTDLRTAVEGVPRGDARTTARTESWSAPTHVATLASSQLPTQIAPQFATQFATQVEPRIATRVEPAATQPPSDPTAERPSTADEAVASLPTELPARAQPSPGLHRSTADAPTPSPRRSTGAEPRAPTPPGSAVATGTRRPALRPALPWLGAGLAALLLVGGLVAVLDRPAREMAGRDATVLGTSPRSASPTPPLPTPEPKTAGSTTPQTVPTTPATSANETVRTMSPTLRRNEPDRADVRAGAASAPAIPPTVPSTVPAAIPAAIPAATTPARTSADGTLRAPIQRVPDDLSPTRAQPRDDAPPVARERPARPAAGEKCSDILRKGSLEPLTADESAYLRKECR